MEENEMKKVLALLLVLAMLFAFAACGEKPAAPAENNTPAADPQPEATQPEATQPEATEPEAGSGEEASGEETSGEPEAVVYVPLTIDFKNKTGSGIVGLYLYEAGSENYGDSLVVTEWPDKDTDGDAYEFYAYVVRPEGAVMNLTVLFADSTSATWENLTIADHDKLSLKGGMDPASWEQEPCDDPADIEAMDALKGGPTSDCFYPGYEVICLELKNKNEESLNITGFVLYEDAADASAYTSVFPGTFTKDENNCGLVSAEGEEVVEWLPGKGGLYLYGFVIRPAAASYSAAVTFSDGSVLEVTDMDLLTPDGDGNLPNEISVKSAVDGDLWKVQYDDDAAIPGLFDAALLAGATLDGWYPAY